MVIETERLLLREFTHEDFPALFGIFSDPETMRHYLKLFDENHTKDWIEWNLQNYKVYGFGLWAVVLRETGEFIGDCGLTIQNIDGESLPEIGYHIHNKSARKHTAFRRWEKPRTPTQPVFLSLSDILLPFRLI